MLYFKNTLALTAIAVLGITGCSVKDNSMDSSINTSSEKIVQLQKQLENKDAKISQLEEEKSHLQAIQQTEVYSQEGEVSVQNTSSKVEREDKNALSNSLVPLNAKAGECYAKVLVPASYESKISSHLTKEAQNDIKIIPATYKVVEKKVTLREESTKIVTIPATYKESSQRVMITPKFKKIVSIPATYKTVTQNIQISPETKKIITVPATYKKVVEKREIKPAYSTWKKGRGLIEKVDNSTGEILCLVEVPATYETIEKKVIDKAAYTKEVVIPAKYKKVQRSIVDKPAHTKEENILATYKVIPTKTIDTPARTEEITIPAICKIVKTREIETPAKEVKTKIPAEYKDVTSKVKTKDSYLRWQSILCETNTTPDIISQLQQALQDRKYNITSIDGVYGPETRSAVNVYQKDNKLSEGALTLKTLKSLELK